MTTTRHSFEEFKLLYESTEKVTDRRHSANRWNYSICTAILIASAVLFSWGLANPTFLVVAILATLLLSAMAALLCTLWIGQIGDFKELNNAKFSVLNQMAPTVAFGVPPENIESFCVFQKEWDALQQRRALQEVASHNLIALKSSNIEFLLPKALRVLFISICVGSIVFGSVNWNQLSTSTLSIPTPSAAPTAVKTP